MADIYLMGHGAWDTIGASQTFVTVPANTSITFYTPIGRFISAGQCVAIVKGAGDKLAPYSVVEEFKSAPNLTLADGLFPIEVQAILTTGVRFARVIEPTKLSDLLEKYAGNRLHWLACQPRLGGKDTTEGGFNDDYR